MPEPEQPTKPVAGFRPIEVAAGSERRARLFQEFDLFRRRCAAENRVPMREAAEAGDHITMAQRIVAVARLILRQEPEVEYGAGERRRVGHPAFSTSVFVGAALVAVLPAPTFAAIFLATGSSAASAFADESRSVLRDRGVQALVVSNRPAITTDNDIADKSPVELCDDLYPMKLCLVG